MIALGSDHVGFALKAEIAAHLRARGVETRDLGTLGEERVDYCDYGFLVGEAVARGEYEKGILFCGTGVGISIAANKVRGIRAVVCSEPYSAQLSRRHNDTNILALGARVVGVELAKAIVDQWLAAEPEGGRHAGRIAKIARYEERNR